MVEASFESKTLHFDNPATGNAFGSVRTSTRAQVQQAVGDMRRAAMTWSNMPVAERVRILRKFQGVLIDSADEITAVLNQDCGKSRQDGLIEVFMVVDMLSEYLKHAVRWLAP